LWCPFTDYDADKFGYIPENQYTQGSQLCRRCFRINHYGKDEIGPVQADRSLDEINMGIRWSTGVVLVVDILDSKPVTARIA